ncbi:MAG: transcription elongation factor GreB [Myxococcales bacterium]|nr:transcription elongation factor GreB [Myxococcales bacterium]MDH5305587.1 transcription elongation factor GreB [Myxococcales bacterium]MDH5567488.1 transcription elongation factor GreB [Myxococcales bacterium]
MSRRRAPQPPRSPYITPEGVAQLREEYQRLRWIERPRVTQQVSEAAAQGDRSENAEYIYGKKRLREIDSRLEFLVRRLDELVVVQPQDRGDDVIYFGAWVRLADAQGDELEYRIVGPDEFDVRAGCISMDSPFGRALLGKRTGDEVSVQRPNGAALFEILAVRYQR